MARQTTKPSPGYTPTHVDALKSLYRGHDTPASMARDLMISERLAHALLADLTEGGYAHERKAKRK